MVELCECREEHTPLVVETDKAIYEIEFGQIQFEITGKCNMFCQHCRASQEPPQDMPIDQIVKMMTFARRHSPNYKEVVVSGGEPFLHHDFAGVLRAIRRNGGESVSLTTNGSILKEKHLNLIEELEFTRFTISVSLDSLNPDEHDRFRGYPGAYSRAIQSLQLAIHRRKQNLRVSMRTTLRPHQIPDMRKFADFAFNLGCDRISFSAIHPAGRALERPDLWMSKDQKRQFIRQIYELKGSYPETFTIRTNDPLKCLVRGYADLGKEDEVVFDGCVAGSVTFNICADGTMTPCALMNLPMMQVFK